MATLTVLNFATAQAADEAAATVQSLQKQHLTKLYDAALVTWPAGKKTPSTRQLPNLVTAGPPGGMFWAMLFGLVFFTPLLGMGVGPAVSPAGGMFKDYGIDDDFIRRVRNAVKEGNSALFVMTSEPVADRFMQTMKHRNFETIATSISRGATAA